MTAMADTPTDDAPPKKSKMPLILGLVLALAGGGGGFFVVNAGLIGGGDDAAVDESADHAAETGDHVTDDVPAPVAFVPLEPMVISLQGAQKYLRFTAQLEVDPTQQADIVAITPRIVDVLNGYLRAVDMAELADPAALMRLRAQMLRRVQVVAGGDGVRDLLIMEFVLN